MYVQKAKFGKSNSKALSSPPAQEQIAEANTDLSTNYRFECSEVAKPQKVYIHFPLPNGLCQHWRKQITVTQPVIKFHIVQQSSTKHNGTKSKSYCGAQ